MKAMQRVFILPLSLSSLAVLCQATALGQAYYTPSQTNVVVVQTNVVVMQTNAPPPEEKEKRFHACELDLSPYAVYVDKLPGSKWGGGAALTYYPIRVLGIGASSYLNNFKGTAIDNVEGEAYLRLPILDLLAPYAVGGAGYEFDHDYGFETVGGGFDLRPLRHIGLFGDAQYRFSNNDSRSRDGVLVRLGLRFSF